MVTPNSPQQGSGSKIDDASIVNAEINVLQSRTVAKRVINKLKLMDNPEFNMELDAPRPLVVSVKQAVKRMLSAGQPNTPEVALINVTDNVLERLDATMDARSYVVDVSFTSQDPRLAQQVANAFVAEYLANQVESRYNSSKEASKWMSQNVSELRDKVVASERAVQEFTQEHNLYQLSAGTINDQQLTELNTQVVTAQAEYAQAKARLDRIRSGGDAASSPEVLQSPLIQQLRGQEAELRRERSTIVGQYGPQHPKMTAINNEISDLDQKISVEISKIVQAQQSEVGSARDRLGMASGQLNAAKGTVGVDKKLLVQLNQLQREADANKELYNTTLASMKQTSEAGNTQQVTAKVISQADLPLVKSSPRTLLILLFSLVLGGMTGCATALLLEHLNMGFTGLAKVEQVLGLPGITMIPEASRKAILADNASQYPSSSYAEALRRIVAGIRFPASGEAAHCLMICSATQQEGKGWLSTSLARLISKSGKKVLLLDCDMHRDMALHTREDFTARPLNEYLAGKVPARRLSMKRKPAACIISARRMIIATCRSCLIPPPCSNC